MTEKAATPVLTVTDAIAEAIPTTRQWAKLAVEAIGIDPDMPVETLRSHLRAGKRIDDVLANGRDRLEENEWGLVCAISYLHDNSWGFASTQDYTDSSVSL